MCGGGGGGIGGFLNRVQDFAPLRDTFGDRIDYAISPLLSGNQTALGGTQATPGSYAEGLYKSTGYDQMQPAVDMFGKAIASAGLGSYLSGAGSTGGTYGGTDLEAAGTSAPNAPGGAPATGGSPVSGGSDQQQLLGQGDQTQMPPAQAENPAALEAMGLQNVGPGQFTQGGQPIYGVPQMPPAQAPNAPQQAPQQPAQPGQPAASGQAPGSTDQQLPGQQAPQQGRQPSGQQPGAQPQTQQQGGGTVQQILNAMKNNPLGTASIAMLGANALAAKPKQNQAVQQQQQISAQAQQQAQQLLAQYQSGTLSAGQQAQLDQLSQNTKNQLRQYFASIGQSDSTAAAQSLAQVDAQAQQMKQQMLDNALTQGLSALGIASGPLNSIANYQLGQDKQLRDAFGNFATQVGTIFGRQSAQTPTQQPGTATNQTTTQPQDQVTSSQTQNQ